MGHVGRIVAGAILTVAGVVVGVFSGNWTLAFAISSAGIGLLTQPRMPKMGDLTASQGAILENRVGTLQCLPVAYGTVRLGGVFADIRVDSASASNKRLVLVPVWCHGSRDGSGINAIRELWFNDQKAVDTSGTIQAPFSNVVDGQTALAFGNHLGTTSDVVDSRLHSLFPTEWPNTSKGLGVAYTRLELWYSQDIYAGGIPTVQALIQGNRVFDPRDNTWKFSSNPALCIRDYICSAVYGMGISESKIEDQSFIDMANYCDELVNVPGGGTQARYALNGWVDTSRSVEQNLADLCTSCRGQIVNEGDRWRMVIRRARAISGFKITEKNTLEGTWQFILPGNETAPNVARASYVDPNQNYEVDTVQWPEPGQANTYLSDDNNFEQRLEIDLPFTQDRIMAQQILMTILKEQRKSIGCTCALREEALQCRIGDLVQVTQPTPGWVDKVFDVAALLLGPDASVQAVLIEYDPTIYTNDSQFTQLTPTTPNLPNPFGIAAPTSVVLTSGDAEAIITVDGVKVPRIKMTWTPPSDPFLEHYEVQAKKTADSTFDSYGTAAKTDTLFFVGPVTSASWDVRIRAVNTLGVVSSWVTSTITPSPTGSSFTSPSFSFGPAGSPGTGLPLYKWAVDASSPAIGFLSASDGATNRNFLKADWNANLLTFLAQTYFAPASGSWTKATLETGITAKVYLGADNNGLNFTTNAVWNGSSWNRDDVSKPSFAIIEHLGNSQMEFRVSQPAANPITWTTMLTIQAASAVIVGTDPGGGALFRVAAVGNGSDSAIFGTRDSTINYVRIDGLRISGDDASNTIYNATKDIVISRDTGGFLRLVQTSTNTIGLSVNTTDGSVTINSDPEPGSTTYIFRAGGRGRFRSGVDDNRSTQIGLGAFQDATTVPLYELQTADADTNFGQDALLLYTGRWSSAVWFVRGSASGDRAFARLDAGGTSSEGIFSLFDCSALTGGNRKVYLCGDGTGFIGSSDPATGDNWRVGGTMGITGQIFWALSSTKRWAIGLSGLGGLQFQPQAGAADTHLYFVDSGSATRGALDISNGKLWLASDPGGSAVLRVGGDIRVGSLGDFDSGTTPTADQLLSWDASVSKWRPRTVQLSFNSGVMVAGTLNDGTSFTAANSNPSLSGTPSAPGSAPIVTPIYGGFIIDMGATALPANTVYVLDYQVNGGGFTSGAIVVTSSKVVHQIVQSNNNGPFNSSTTFAYKFKLRGGSDSSFSPTSSAQTYSTKTEVNAFGLIAASQISTVNLAAIVADLGIITAGRIQDGTNAFGVRVSSGYTIPGTWRTYLDLPGGLLVVKDNQGSPVTRVQVGKVGGGTTDYGLQVFDASGATVMDFTGAKRIMAVPLQDQGSKSVDFNLDLSTGLTQIVQLGASSLNLTLQNAVNGGRYRIWFQQDATGSRSFPNITNAVMYTNDAAPTLTTTPGALDLFEFEFRSSPTARFTCISLQTNVILPAPKASVQSATGQLFSVASTTHNVTMPSTVNAGDLLIILFVGDLNQGNNVPTTPSGWTLLQSQVITGANQAHITAFVKVAAGTEGGTTVNVVTSNSVKGNVGVWRITQWFGSLSGVFASTGTTAGSANPDATSATPGWTDRSMWIAVFGSYNDPVAVTADPANYGADGVNLSVGTAGQNAGFVRAMDRKLFAATENPGAWTLASALTWGAFTIAVRPPA